MSSGIPEAPYMSGCKAPSPDQPLDVRTGQGLRRVEKPLTSAMNVWTTDGQTLVLTLRESPLSL